MGTAIEPTGDEVQGETPDQSEAPGLNPAWSEVLSVLPENFHSVVTPHFQQWDNAAQAKIEAANATLKEFEGYKPYVEHGIAPDDIEQSLRIMYQINNDPESVYKALAEAYKYGQAPATPVANESGESVEEKPAVDIAGNPEFAKLQQGLELVSQIVLNDAQAKQDAAADIALDKELADLKTEHGEFDEKIVLSLMQSGMTAKDAHKTFSDVVNSQKTSFAPNILGGTSSGAGVPSNAIDVTKLDGKSTRNLVAEMLKSQLS
jgi:hypothetical protein